ncbi:trifunctional purine biosynthetic protein adenosine-3-like isoform X2 [Gouania willdenowi]|uniref:trifunctional purine biosynthetic protein adenosine-3-like isoform X2 n=1 Tax=Gouania willdenowi TaxID=441366 RepID=UPI001055A76F|nr:trifunctional purine biosynthetic protein adenosine-3-like isoform X2 [Gouania willdenowi]
METSLVKQNSDQRRRRVGVLISGTGTKLQALMDQASSPSEIVLVVSNRPGVQGLKRATLAGIQTRVYASPAEFDATIDHVLEEFKVALVCLAGFTRILTGTIVKKWNGKLLNIHPLLLPSFKGVNAQKQALQAGVRVSGCTVHFVAEEVDAGAIIVQEAVEVLSSDREDQSSRTQSVSCCYGAGVQWVCEAGGGRTHCLGKKLLIWAYVYK